MSLPYPRILFVVAAFDQFFKEGAVQDIHYPVRHISQGQGTEDALHQVLVRQHFLRHGGRDVTDGEAFDIRGLGKRIGRTYAGLQHLTGRLDEFCFSFVNFYRAVIELMLHAAVSYA